MRTDILGVKVDRDSMEDTVQKIQKAVEAQKTIQVVTANPELIYATGRDVRLKQLINGAEIVTPDGVGVVWAAKRLGHPVVERVTGIDLVEALFPIAAEQAWRVFFLGSRPGVAEKAAQRVAEKHPGFQWQAAHGYFSSEEEPALLMQIREFKPDILLIGLGAPRQEFWMFSHLDLSTVSVGVGGSFDALAGINKRAPRWIRNIHLEWLYRLIKQPTRLKRQLVLPRFVWKVLRSGKEKRRTRKVR
ncbi:teichoic acid biosynthesis protein [Desulfitobacterium dehalogenans ATCC 51507]|uniref:N-acetylglucosaminyldiphosphoundecaprenol N-acetyl-beta-D-mannosaminyltransferase n=1 Tax=Desulfitobacterium dehalogenans (strain ATCC 51507 / DSM 9161 / JW/IU-DC1) TaxID=756499 RepID=I4AEF0_DESDJ|nr:WecB/TagA/CpsF family glycosyltransferase [Desulfitobacterium dehalogenans]AFM02335.1 teichoic acid biosynthesis protein [Desulfitobacterium dehalogenans ATCC 51507]